MRRRSVAQRSASNVFGWLLRGARFFPTVGGVVALRVTQDLGYLGKNFFELRSVVFACVRVCVSPRRAEGDEVSTYSLERTLLADVVASASRRSC